MPNWLWSISFILLLLLLRGQTLLAAERANDQAVAAVSFCLEAQTSPSADATGSRFAAVQARCRGDEAQEEEAWRRLLTGAGARPDVIRAARPYDVSLARLAAERYPARADTHFWLGDALREAGNRTAAIVAYEAGLALDPTAALIWDYVGRLYEDGGDLEKAVYAYDQACYYVDRGKNGCLHAGRIYLEQGLYAEAAVRYRTSLQQLPGYAQARRGLVEALLAQDQIDEAIPHLEALAAQGDENAQKTLAQLAQRTE